MKRILVTMPDELHELLKELAVRKKTSVSKLLLTATEDAYEDELDAILADRLLAEAAEDPEATTSWEEFKASIKSAV